MQTVNLPGRHWLKRKFQGDVAKFFCRIQGYEDFAYLLALLRFSTAPTAIGGKIGTLVNLYSSKRDLCTCFKKYRDFLEESLGLETFLLRENERGILVYFYHSKRLKKRLEKKSTMDWLVRQGYGENPGVNEALEILRMRFQRDGACPNEVGIFLGYPIEDVIAFAKHRRDEKCVGYWKCYRNPGRSKMKFLCYDLLKWMVTKSVPL